MLKTSKKRKNLVSTINKVKTRFNKSEGAGARTLDLRIKSPLLYQLSYALGVQIHRQTGVCRFAEDENLIGICLVFQKSDCILKEFF